MDNTMSLWAIKAPMGWLMPYTVRRTRAEAIKHFVGEGRKDWRYWKRKGCSAVKVEVKEISEKTEQSK